MIFVVGKSSKIVDDRLKDEFQLNGDLVQEDFLDNYNNLTIKTIVAFKWASIYCKNAKYLLKIDDDIMVNTPKLVEWLDKSTLFNTFLCQVWWNSKVIRDANSKHFVSKNDYQKDVYDPCKFYYF